MIQYDTPQHVKTYSTVQPNQKELHLRRKFEIVIAVGCYGYTCIPEA